MTVYVFMILARNVDDTRKMMLKNVDIVYRQSFINGG